jgi:hypothetical protein
VTISTYAQLQTAITDFLNRDDLASVVPTFISLAEADMSRRVRHWRMEKRATASFDAQFSEVPPDWVETIKLSVSTDNGPQEVALVSHSDMANMRHRLNDQSGSPQFYSMSAGQFELLPTPSAATTATLLYVAELDALSGSNPSNWILDRFPDAYLYGALQHSAPYLSDDQRIAIWGALYQSTIDAINADSQSSKYSGTGLRMRVKGLR